MYDHRSERFYSDPGAAAEMGPDAGAGPLTHEHCDHIGGLNELRRTYPVTVAATEACSAGIGNQTRNMSRMMETFLYFKGGEKKLVHYPPFQCRKADLTFTDRICCNCNKAAGADPASGAYPREYGDPI